MCLGSSDGYSVSPLRRRLMQSRPWRKMPLLPCRIAVRSGVLCGVGTDFPTKQTQLRRHSLLAAAHSARRRRVSAKADEENDNNMKKTKTGSKEAKAGRSPSHL